MKVGGFAGNIQQYTKMNAENAEKNLWDQMRSITQISIRIAQWGITTLLGLLTALFFIRREMLAGLPDLPPRHPLPVIRFIPGNLVLWVVAILFFRMSSWIRKRLFYYMNALRELPKAYPDDKVKVYPPLPETNTSTPVDSQKTWPLLRITHNNKTMGVHIVTLFFFVPIADCILYATQWLFYWMQV